MLITPLRLKDAKKKMKKEDCVSMQLGGSVMCVRTLSSDPAHLHFSLNCLPDEEEIKK